LQHNLLLQVVEIVGLSLRTQVIHRDDWRNIPLTLVDRIATVIEELRTKHRKFVNRVGSLTLILNSYPISNSPFDGAIRTARNRRTSRFAVT
jgi:hypothetical protein